MTQIVGGLLWDRSRKRVLLVEQKWSADPYPHWAIPAGRRHGQETHWETLRRELQEETGLMVTSSGQLLYAVHVGDTRTWIYEVTAWQGEINPNDPDDFITDAAFWPVRPAIERLAAGPYRMMWEPAVAYLRQEMVIGATWIYGDEPAGYPLLAIR